MEQQELIHERGAVLLDKPTGATLAKSQPTPMDLLEIAMNQQADVDKLTKLWDLQKDWERAQARKQFSEAFVQMRPNIPKVIRTKDNTQTKSKYAPLEDINSAIDPVLKEYGFSTATKVVGQSETSVTVRAELWHKGGHVESTEITMPLDKTGIQGSVNKTGPHALSSSVTYGKRVALCALLNISTGDDQDGNQEGVHVPSDWLSERLEWIANSNREELHKIFTDAFEKARKAKDTNAMARFITAKDNRKEELGGAA